MKLRILPLLLLLGCTPSITEADHAIVDTRGVVVKEIIVKGPGGDGFGADFVLPKKTVFHPWDLRLYQNIVIAAAAIWIMWFYSEKWRHGPKS